MLQYQSSAGKKQKFVFSSGYDTRLWDNELFELIDMF